MSATPEDYTATLCQKDRERYEEKTRLCAIHTLCGRPCKRCGLVAARRQTSSITAEQLKSRKALEGHNFVTSGWEPWANKFAADTVIIVAQVRRINYLTFPCVPML
ncbi:hypothetical protein HPB52_004506 [Rhipicephalus sanguineus]|uniref:Uncharacterized protein n=1 Tax=Rhipicephalus sanguineus TaxID=34632 RepID=A0A9D4Q4Q5_RHISA|nr:hypothetical protein HPB52_004506 [Rhipicephalus sanguineus]